MGGHGGSRGCHPHCWHPSCRDSQPTGLTCTLCWGKAGGASIQGGSGTPRDQVRCSPCWVGVVALGTSPRHHPGAECPPTLFHFPSRSSLPLSPTTLLLLPSSPKAVQTPRGTFLTAALPGLELGGAGQCHLHVPQGTPSPAPSAPRSPGTVPRAGRSPYPALPCPALPRLARRWGCRAPFQRTPGYGGELHAASESSPSLGKSLRGSSPAARLPATRAPARAAGTLPPRRGHAQARAARSRLEELPRAPRLQGSTSGMWDGMSIPRPRDEHPLAPAR